MGSSPSEAQLDPARHMPAGPGIPVSLDLYSKHLAPGRTVQSPPPPLTTSLSKFTGQHDSPQPSAAAANRSDGPQETDILPDEKSMRDRSAPNHSQPSQDASSHPQLNLQSVSTAVHEHRQTQTQVDAQSPTLSQNQRQKRSHSRRQQRHLSSSDGNRNSDTNFSDSATLSETHPVDDQLSTDRHADNGKKNVSTIPTNSYFASPLPSLHPTTPASSAFSQAHPETTISSTAVIASDAEKPVGSPSVDHQPCTEFSTVEQNLDADSLPEEPSTKDNTAPAASEPPWSVLDSPAPSSRKFSRATSSEFAVRSVSADELDSSLKRAAIDQQLVTMPPETGSRVDDQLASVGEHGTGNDISKTKWSSNPAAADNPDDPYSKNINAASASREPNAPNRASRFFHFSSMSPSDNLDHGQGRMRGGLLKRLRNAIRGTAQATRARAAARADAKAASGTSAAASADLNENSTSVGGENVGVAPRSRTFGFASSRNLAHERTNSAPVDDENVSRSRRFLGRSAFGLGSSSNQGIAANNASGPADSLPSDSTGGTAYKSRFGSMGASNDVTGLHTNRPDELSASQPLSYTAGRGGNENSRTPALTGGIHRALPKARVFSSPPSFSFSFGSRRRLSLNSNKYNLAANQANGANNSASLLSEGDMGAINKLSRTFNNRGVNDIGRGSGNLNLIAVGNMVDGPTHIPPEHSAAAFRVALDAVVANQASFCTLLDVMYHLEERLPPDTKEILIKYLSNPERIMDLIDNLTVVVPVASEDEGVQGPGDERYRYRYSYVSSMLLSNGPIQLRRSLFLNPKLLDRLVGVLGLGTPTDAFVVRPVCKVLLSVMRDSPEDTVCAMVRRKDFLDALLSHISVTGCAEVCLTMLSAVRCQAELKFGPANKSIVSVMANANMLHTLCDKLVDAARTNPIDGAASSAIENCSRVIVGIALRVLVIPRFEVNEDETDAERMLKFNRDLESLDVFQQPEPIFRLLDSGFEALDGHDERGYALSTALTAVRYLLATAISGQDSSLSTLRTQLLNVRTSAYEAGIRQRIPRLAHVLRTARSGSQVCTMWNNIEGPLGVVRIKILELLVVLLQHGGPETAHSIAEAGIPHTLVDLFSRLELNSLLQHFVATIIEHSFRVSPPVLRKSFLLDVNLIDTVMQLWQVSSEREQTRRITPVSNLGELSRIAIAIQVFLSSQSFADVPYFVSRLGNDRIQKFAAFCDGPVAEHDSLNGQLLGGVERLPHRIDEDGGFGDGAGAIFFRPRTGSAAVDA